MKPNGQIKAYSHSQSGGGLESGRTAIGDLQVSDELESMAQVPSLKLVLRSKTPARCAQAGFAGRCVKRTMDILLALPVVLLIFPLLALVVKIGHWLQSPGPLFFRQERCGRHQSRFVILKFRTMNIVPPGVCEISDSPERRIFPFGNLLRSTKLDEIPQFVNVLFGSMSIVGPRPHHFWDCCKFEEAVEGYSQRTIVKPGITGLAQITEFRGDFEWNCVESRVSKDLDYIQRWSILLDLSLIVNTAAVIITKSFGLNVVAPAKQQSAERTPVPAAVRSQSIVASVSIRDAASAPAEERRAA